MSINISQYYIYNLINQMTKNLDPQVQPQPLPIKQSIAQHKVYKLTTKNLFNHFLLVHDFLQAFTKTKAQDPEFLDAQISVNQIMNKATNQGGKFGQAAGFGTVLIYCLKSRSIGLKFLAGFLYIYWWNHFYTLGQYLGALIKMPNAYRRIGQYYQRNSNSHPNLLDRFENYMQTQNYEDETHQILRKLFPQNYQSVNASFTVNNYFQKNRQKYNLPTESDGLISKRYKLPYLDSFLTRYIYYSFARWLHRVRLFVGLSPQ